MERKNLYFCVILCLLVVTTLATAQDIERQITRTSEKEVKVKITASFGSVNISKGNSDKIVQVYYRKKHRDEEPRLDLDYYIHNDVGDLRLEMNPKGVEVRSREHGDRHNININVNDFDFKSEEWYIKLVDDIPLSIKAELGAGKNNFDFSGLNISDLSISTGASSSTVEFDKKNENEIDEFKIETGVSKFVAENLNNANFRKLSFDGGVGSYYLDFGGELTHTVDVDVNVGLGAVKLTIPSNIGVRIKYQDSWLSNLSVDDEFIRMKKGVYETENYLKAEGRMNIYIASGLGSVKIRRSR